MPSLHRVSEWFLQIELHEKQKSETKLLKGKHTAIDVKQYRGMIGSLLYLSASRPDIMFSVCMCARFQSNPKQSHLSVVKRIIRYLVGTMNLGLLYPRE